MRAALVMLILAGYRYGSIDGKRYWEQCDNGYCYGRQDDIPFWSTDRGDGYRYGRYGDKPFWEKRR